MRYWVALMILLAVGVVPVVAEELNQVEMAETIARLRADNEQLKEDVKTARREIDALKTKLVYIGEENRILQSRIQEVYSYKSSPRVQPITGGLDVEAEDEVPEPGKTIRVRQGETLSSIAEREYGNIRYWKALLKANKKVLANERSLAVGMKLVVPSRRKIKELDAALK